MKLYKMTVNAETKTVYAGTLRLAQAAGKEVSKPLREDVLITEVNVSTDKAGMVKALNGMPDETPTGNSWSMAARGGLVPVVD